MKEKVIIFLVGLLLGAIISTGSIYIYTIANNHNNGNNVNIKMPNDNKNQGGMMDNNGTTPPEIPNNPSTN